jgi:hypothetical protein
MRHVQLNLGGVRWLECRRVETVDKNLPVAHPQRSVWVDIPQTTRGVDVVQQLGARTFRVGCDGCPLGVRSKHVIQHVC